MSVPNEMSICDLANAVKDIRENVTRIDQLSAIMQTDTEIHDGTNRLMKEKFSIQCEIVYTLNGTRNRLSDYADLLERVMRDTKLPWPPRTAIPD